MTSRLVVEHPLFPVQVHDTALVELPNLQSGFLAQRPVAPLKLGNQAEARQREVDNAMQLQIYEQMFMLGTLFQTARADHALFIAENKMLRQHILQRTGTLEKEWIGIAEIFSARMDILHRGLGNFELRFLTECHETRKIWDFYLSCEFPGGPGGTWDWNMPTNWNWDKLNPVFHGNYSKLGASIQMNFLHSKYACHVREPLSATRKLYLTGRDSLKALVRAEIQKIQMESLLEEEAIDISRDLQQVHLSNPIDERSIFQLYAQTRQEEIKMIEERNLPLKNENASLKRKKDELEKMDERFLAVFHKHFTPCFQLLDGIKEMKNACGIIFSECCYKRMNVFNPSLRAGCEAKAIEQKAKFEAHFKEIKPLVQTLKKKDSP